MKRSSPSVPEASRTINQLYDEAVVAMTDAQAKEGSIHPAVVVLATNDRRVIDEALASSVGLHSRKARYLRDAQYDLSRASRRRTVYTVVALGLVAGAGILFGLGRDKAYFDKAFDNPERETELIGDPLFANNNLVKDDSFLPGDVGTDIPVINVLARNVPGVPDFGASRVVRTEAVEQYVTEKEDTITAGYTAERSQNPVSLDLSLTGTEYKIGREAAARFLSKLDSDTTFSADSLTVTGEVSDEYGGEIGVTNPEQSSLALDRGRVALQALIDEATEQGKTLPEVIQVIPSEAVLDEAAVREVVELASAQGLSVDQLLTAYNTGAELQRETIAKLDEHLASHRGATFTATGTRKTTENITRLKEVEERNEDFFDDIPGEAVLGLWLALPAQLAILFSGMGDRSKSVRRKARRMARKAGLDIN